MDNHVVLVALPILDLRRFAGGTEERADFLKSLRVAARDHGFFYLIGHGINPSLVADAKASAKRFFALPVADKLAIEMVNSPHFRGYNRAGQELTRGRPDWREQVDIGAERPAIPIGSDTPPWERLQGPNQWPPAYPELRQVLLNYIDALTALAVRLLETFALALGQAENVFHPIYAPTPNLLLKIIRYPGRNSTTGDQGVGAHKDGGFLTLLLQDTQRGLQVEDAAGNWIVAEPIDGSFVVNIGELLELASDGYLKATVHRAVTPPADTERLSIGFFLGASLGATVPQLVLPPDLATEAHGVTRDPNNPLLRNVGLNALKSRLRSHPDVAQRHHADLLAAPLLAG